jgi:putative endonuclease
MWSWIRSKLAGPLGLAQPPKTTKAAGDAAENRALVHLQRAGLTLLARNLKTPGRGGGELDLVMQDGAGVIVFVEVRARRNALAGGAAASVSTTKQKRIVFAARYFLQKYHGARPLPPCRFDVVTVEGGELVWLKAAFSAD